MLQREIEEYSNMVSDICPFYDHRIKVRKQKGDTAIVEELKQLQFNKFWKQLFSKFIKKFGVTGQYNLILEVGKNTNFELDTLIHYYRLSKSDLKTKWVFEKGYFTRVHNDEYLTIRELWN